MLVNYFMLLFIYLKTLRAKIITDDITLASMFYYNKYKFVQKHRYRYILQILQVNLIQNIILLLLFFFLILREQTNKILNKL